MVTTRNASLAGAVVTAITLVLSSALAAQSREPALVHLSWTEFGDPLQPPGVYAITQDREGFIWLGMLGGPVRFDGVRFTSWDALGRPALPERPVTALATARDGAMWLGYGNLGGISKYTDTGIRHFTVRDGVPAGAIRAILVTTDGDVWAVGYGGLARHHGDRWTLMDATHGFPPGAIAFIREDEHRTLWVASEAGVFRRAPGDERFTRSAPGTSPARVFGEDSAAGVRRHRVAMVVAPPNPTVTPQGLRDSRGHFWVWVGDGLRVVRPDASTPEHLTFPDRLSDRQVTAIFEDRHGAIWVGTSRGLDTFRPRLPGAPQIRTDVAAQTLTTLSDGDDVWAGTADGLFRITGNRVVSYSTRDGLPGTRVSALHLDASGSLWVAGDAGIAVRRGLRFVTVAPRNGRVFSQVSALATDRDGGLWVAEFQALRRLQDGSVSTPVVPGLEQEHASVVYTDRRDRVWIGFWNGSVARYDAGRFRVYTTADGLSAGRVTTIMEDAGGTMWAGSLNGVSRLDGDRWLTPGHQSGLDGLMVQWLHRDARNRLWMGTNSGIVRIDVDEVDRASRVAGYRPRFRLFGPPIEAARFATGAAGQPRVAETPDGRIWLTASTGLATIDTAAAVDAPPPPVRIEQVAIDDRPVGLDAPVRVGAGATRIRFDYTALALGGTSRVIFRYRLDGFDQGWVEAGSARQATYTNLPPGTYLFHASASHDGSPWAEATLGVPLTVLPPFYRTTWFYAAGVTVVALLLWGVWELRVRQLRWHYSAVLAERARLGRELHDTLLQGMAGVALQLQSLVNRESHEADVAARLSRARDTLEHYIRETRNSIWDLRSPVLEHEPLANAIRLAGETLTAGTGVTFELQTTGVPVRGASSVEAHLLRIAHEAIANAVRHGHSTVIRVLLHYEDHNLRLTVLDNGQGFDSASPSSPTNRQWGLTTMRERAEQIGARFRCASGPDGTTVEAIARLGAEPS
ncbi:MAG: two-component regulator propeller domain-containing protein [Vicinamibacterales bacterium]